jgi:uncharacterized protein (TIGR02145 family)
MRTLITRIWLYITGMILAIIAISCEIELPSLTTTEVTEITGNSATSGGTITDDGGAAIKVKGVVWSTTENPAFDNKDGLTSDGAGSGQFTSKITGLTPGETYFVRAYSVNSEGASYGDQVQFTTIKLPSVATRWATDIFSNSAISGGTVTDDGGAEVTEKGLAFGTSENPTTTDNTVPVVSETMSFTVVISGLSPETTYYVRAYATNLEGTGYGNQHSFETFAVPDPDKELTGDPCPGMPTFTDPRDGNVYNTVQIGDQCWLKENLKYLPELYPWFSDGSSTEPRYYVYGHGDDISVAMATYSYNYFGVLYNWPAAMNGASSSSSNPGGVQGVCPAGWQLPSDAEWTQLTDYLNEVHGILNTNTVDGAGNALKSCCQGDSPLGGECAICRPGWSSDNTHFGTDEFGFSALPGGGHINVYMYGTIWDYGFWWSSTESSSSKAWSRSMRHYRGDVERFDHGKRNGFSVRCVMDID